MTASTCTASLAAALLLFLLSLALLTLVVLLIDILIEGAGHLSGEFLTETPSCIDPASSGIQPAIVGSCS